MEHALTRLLTQVLHIDFQKRSLVTLMVLEL